MEFFLGHSGSPTIILTLCSFGIAYTYSSFTWLESDRSTTALSHCSMQLEFFSQVVFFQLLRLRELKQGGWFEALVDPWAHDLYALCTFGARRKLLRCQITCDVFIKLVSSFLSTDRCPRQWRWRRILWGPLSALSTSTNEFVNPGSASTSEALFSFESTSVVCLYPTAYLLGS